MAEKRVVKIQHLVAFFQPDHLSCIGRGENSYESQNVESFVYDADLKVMRGIVWASMKTHKYDVQVSTVFIFISVTTVGASEPI